MYFTICKIDDQRRSMHEQGIQSQSSATTQMDRLGMVLGGGSEWGDTHTPMADSC